MYYCLIEDFIVDCAAAIQDLLLHKFGFFPFSTAFLLSSGSVFNKTNGSLFPILVTYLCISVSKYYQSNTSQEISTTQLHSKNEKVVCRMLAFYIDISPTAREDVDGKKNILGRGYWVLLCDA